LLKLLTIAAFCVILNTDNSQESREQTLFCRNKLSASYPADVILQRKQMEAALVSFSDSLGHDYYRFYYNFPVRPRAIIEPPAQDAKRVEALSSARRIRRMSFSLQSRADRFHKDARSRRPNRHPGLPPRLMQAQYSQGATASRPNAASSVFGFALRPWLVNSLMRFFVSSATPP
jgi:hypothetical protein